MPASGPIEDDEPTALADSVENMVDHHNSGGRRTTTNNQQTRPKYRKAITRVLIVFGICLVPTASYVAFLAHEATNVKTELAAASLLVTELKGQLLSNDANAEKTLDKLRDRTDEAAKTVSTPLWKTASALPLVGSNFSAVREIALSADDLVGRAGTPMLHARASLDWKAITPTNGRVDVSRIAEASPSIVSAANSVDLTYFRLKSIDESSLLPEIQGPLSNAKATVGSLRDTLNMAANASRVLPGMLGTSGDRNYLVLVQNNSEIRATGGLPGALAVVRIDNGAITLAAQSSGSAMGKFDPALPVDRNQEEIYSKRLGTYISDVNLTPDFPTAAATAKAMWEKRFATKIDGVVALDPVVLANVLDASGPLRSSASANGLPDTLTATNVVRTLLSDVYEKLPTNPLQDAYFAAVSHEIFEALASGTVPGDKLISALEKSAKENRIYLWSDHKDEQDVLLTTSVAGSTSGPRTGGATFGAYFNDGTGAKMDFHVRRTAQLFRECTTDDYSRIRVRVTMQNTAPPNARDTLPDSVTGGGRFGVPAGTVQTNVVVYGPVQGHIETAFQDGKKVPFAAQIHEERPLGSLTTRLAPGQRTTLDFVFDKIVQGTQPILFVTPTVQPVKDVILAPVRQTCRP